MTYTMFLMFFLLPPIVLLSVPFLREAAPHRSWFAAGAGILILLAILYTTPWDNYLVATQVWTYPPDRVIGTIGYVPIEEYCFFVLQTILTSLWCYFLQSFWPITSEAEERKTSKFAVAGALVLVWLASLWFLTMESTKYLGLILVWAIPVALLQWMVAARLVIANWKIVATSILVPTFYLCAADRFAIGDSIWMISPLQTTGIQFFGLPMEEALFFLLTNVMVGQGLVLFVAMRDFIALKVGRKFEREMA